MNELAADPFSPYVRTTPVGLPPGAAGAFDLEACNALMRTGSKTFFAASRLLPARVRASSIALYAFCRVADDMVDGGRHSLADAMALLSQRLDAIYAGHPQDPVEDRALAVVVQRHALPRALLDALLDGFAWDAEGRRYETLEDVHDYGARVAGSVGAMMCWIMGVRSPQALARACEMGVAMQLTNIARDVGEDARHGRLYLPRAWLRERGIDVPGDVAVIGFDNWDVMTEAARPPLTSVDMNLAALGHEAGRLLLAMIGGDKVSGIRRLPCTLAIRQSTTR